MTKTESRVLRAIELLDTVAREEYSKPGFTDMLGVQDAKHFGHGYKSILSAVGIVSYGRKSSSRQVSDALKNLAERGVIKHDFASGMGGGMNIYVLIDKETT